MNLKFNKEWNPCDALENKVKIEGCRPNHLEEFEFDTEHRI
jgi:hypothetical protein